LRSSASSRTSTKLRESPADLERRSLRHEATFAGLIGALLSVLAFGYCFPRHMLLLYGDAVAHMGIARRILDSLSPGISQIGSVWLPFPHLIMIPFVARLSWWQNGIAGAIPSMIAYVLSVAGLWRLCRYWLRPAGAVAATLFFALNPGLLYMQTTAMNEPLFLCQMIWAAVFLMAFLRGVREPSSSGPDSQEGRRDGPSRPEGRSRAAGAIVACGLVLVTAIFTRYDAWIFACLVWLIALWGLTRAHSWKTTAGGGFTLFTALIITAPMLWFIWNQTQYGDWLDFLRGPYSAKAIEARTTPPGSYHYPGWHHLWWAWLYFLKAAQLGAAPVKLGFVLLIVSAGGILLALVFWRKANVAPFLLLWLPLPFYTYSVAYGSVPIFLPIWFPHSYYNTRYGMELLPAFALAIGFVVAWLVGRVEKRHPREAQLILLASIILILVNTAVLIHKVPLVLQEAIANSRTRIPFEQAYARALDALPPQGPILVWTSDHVGAFQDAGIRLRRTINESDYYQWRAALQAPAQSAAFVVAADKDAVTQAAHEHPEGLTLINIVCSTGQPCVRFYKSSLYHAK
jgi:4-amino-4-deoxy-L-arabinose transferase-like glycosyltransferase